ncbi:uncharacterized protein [Eurosta solidaginis]|uniref:uncharacterized protein isoform X2 n=1 Tax=Eurosta solidaginis TaxID=178769 RepID=UPI0035311AAD
MRTFIICVLSAPLSILIFLTSSCLVAGDPGPCPTNIGYLPMNINLLEGSWYMQSRYIPHHPIDYRCHKTDIIRGTITKHTIKKFQINKDDGSPKVTQQKILFLDDGRFFTKYEGAHASASSASTASSSRGLNIDFDNLVYKIISLDCEKLIIYSCQDLPNDKHAKLLWVYTRKSRPSDEVIKKYKEAVNANGFKANLLKPISHKNCRDYREF